MKYQLLNIVPVVLLVGSLGAAAPAQAQCSVSFVRAGDYRTDRPQSVAVGDFNADPWPDLAVANRFGNNVSILVGSPGGTFLPAVPPTHAVGDGPISVAVGDFNADGKDDLAVANANSSPNVSILLGNGDANATFQPAAHYATLGSGAYSVAVGDFNADGKPDLAVANEVSDNISILLNGDPIGTFPGIPARYDVGDSPHSVAVGYFNADGMPDLAVANLNSNDVSILMGNGDGTFDEAVRYPMAPGSSPISVAVDDFNADGRPDLAVANASGNTVSVLLGGPTGTFQAPVHFGVGVATGPRSVAVGDFNSDGRPDLALANNSGTISILLGSIQLGDPNNMFQAAVNFGAGAGARSVAMGDFNADGRLDLAVANSSGDTGGNSVSVLFNCPADHNGDGFVDGIDYDNFNNDFENSDPEQQMQADYNCDGFVDGIDYDQFNNDFEAGCP